MAGQLQDIATSAPVDLEEHKLIKERYYARSLSKLYTQLFADSISA